MHIDIHPPLYVTSNTVIYHQESASLGDQV
jgi:hypothetical protein